jgi:hypothetical protein
VEELFPESVVFPASPVEMGPDPDDVELDVDVVEDDEVDEVVELPGSVGPLSEPVVVGDPVVVVFPELVELVTPVGAEVGVLLVVVFPVEVLLLTPVGVDEVVLDVEVEVVFMLRLVELEDEELERTTNSSTEMQSGRMPVLSSRISLPSLSQMKAFKLSPSIEAKISPPTPTVQSMEEL